MSTDAPADDRALPPKPWYDVVIEFSAYVFSFFQQYRPSHLEAYIVSFLCLIFSIGKSLLEYQRIGRPAFVDTSLYFLILAVLFFIMGRAIQRERG